jgi:protein gp37
MSENSAIAWTHHTFNPWWGCVEVSPACDHCYARVWAKFTGRAEWGKDTARRFPSETYWKEPLKWNRKAASASTRRRVFCMSMGDILEERTDLNPHRERLWSLITETPWLEWLLLTKRPAGYRRLVPATILALPNVWPGATVEHGDYTWRLDHLAALPAAGPRWVSYEPALGPVDFTPWLPTVSWIIVGGESGSQARPFDLDWARQTITQCQIAGVAPFVKQMGVRSMENDTRFPVSDIHDMTQWPEDLRVREYPQS